MYFAHVSLKGDHEDFLYSLSILTFSLAPFLQLWFQSKHLKRSQNLSKPLHPHLFGIVEPLDHVRQRSAAGRKCHLVQGVITVTGNCMSMCIAVVNEKSLAAVDSTRIYFVYTPCWRNCSRRSHTPGRELWHVLSCCLGQFHIKCFTATLVKYLLFDSLTFSSVTTESICKHDIAYFMFFNLKCILCIWSHLWDFSCGDRLHVKCITCPNRCAKQVHEHITASPLRCLNVCLYFSET